MADEGKTNEAWRKILDANPLILRKVSNGGVYEIAAKEIKRYREPRLMTKHDSEHLVPEPLRANDLNVLPISRSAYILGDFKLFHKFPDVTDIRPQLRTLPDFETLTPDNITSESNAINALIAAGILDDFLGEEGVTETFNGRMGTGDFSFWVDRKLNPPAHISVSGAQLEIDGGFETAESVIIMEAKNVPHPDFHVRQLYFPYRKYAALVKKPIRLVFSQYFDQTYYLYEYEFTEIENYSSIRLVKTAAYTFDDRRITSSELWQAYLDTPMRTDDNYARSTITFPQADRVERIFALMERLKTEPEGLHTKYITEFMGTTGRQAAYYPTAGRWLGLFEHGEKGYTMLTARGEKIAKLNHRERQLAVAKLMFEHEILRRCFRHAYTTGEIPTQQKIMNWMRELQVFKPTSPDSMYVRRAQTMLAWTRWLMSLIDDE